MTDTTCKVKTGGKTEITRGKIAENRAKIVLQTDKQTQKNTKRRLEENV